MNDSVDLGWKAVFKSLTAARDLTQAQVHWVADRIFEGASSDIEIAIFASLMQAKGVRPDELRTFAEATFRHSVKLEVDRECLDIVGTGGDGTGAVNISTMAAIVTAAAGHPVVKHGGRAASSAAGSADVIEALGIPLSPGPAQLQKCLADVGLIFCFAPNFHPGLRHAISARRSYGLPTIFNALAPLLNPAQPSFGLMGCANVALAPTIAEVAGSMGSHAFVVRGRDGLDKATLTDVTDIWRFANGVMETWVLDPRDFGFSLTDLVALRGIGPMENAATVTRVLAGEALGPVTDVVVLNAALAILSTYPRDDGFHDGLVRALGTAREVLAKGLAIEKLEQWRQFWSNRGGPQ